MGGFSKDKVTEFGAFQIVDAEVDLDHSLETAGDVHPRMLASDFAIIADTLSCNSFNGYSPSELSVKHADEDGKEKNDPTAENISKT
ncbi:hypothetical protein V6N13_099550 [Hibiscus sabdariffa]